MGELMGFAILGALPEGEPFSLVKVLVIILLITAPMIAITDIWFSGIPIA